MGKVLVFVGPKGSGKDEAFTQLSKNKKAVGKFSFAAPMKELLAEVFDLPTSYMHDPDLKEKPFDEPLILQSKKLKEIKRRMPDYVTDVDMLHGIRKYDPARASISAFENRRIKSPRELMQLLGTELIRGIYANWHVEAAVNDDRWEKLLNSGHLICTDCRFENELTAISERFPNRYEVFYINRPEAEARLDLATHQSELEILKLRDNYVKESRIIDNTGSIKDFEKNLLAAVKSVTGPSTKGRKRGNKKTT